MKKAKKSWKYILCNMVLSSVYRLWSTYSSQGAAHAAPNLTVLWAATEDDSLPLFPSHISSCSPYLLASLATPGWISSTDPTENEHGFGRAVFFGLTQEKWAGGRWRGRGRSWWACGAVTSLLLWVIARANTSVHSLSFKTGKAHKENSINILPDQQQRSGGGGGGDNKM